MLKVITDIFKPDFSKDIHYISWTPNAAHVGGLCYSSSGYSSLSLVYPLVAEQMGFNEEETVNLFCTIDNASETMTLFPAAKITIMPNADDYSDEEIYAHFNDALKAQNLYVRAKNVIFDMSAYSYHNPYQNCADNGEYFYMIQHAYHYACHASQQENWFVICDTAPLARSFRYIPLQELIAKEADYSHFIQKI